MSRNIQDKDLTVTRALPGTGATVTSTSLDFDGVTLGSAAEAVEAVLSVPATPNLADTKNITFTLQDSADDSTFAAIAGVGTLVITGAGGSGAAAAELRAKLPEATRRYFRVSATADTSAGDSTGVDATLTLRG